MKKLKLIAIATLAVLLTVALVACTPAETTVTGEYHYNQYQTEYGAKVDVVVADGKIKSVKLYTDAESNYVNLSPSWVNKKVWSDAEVAYVKKFVGKSVADVNAIVVKVDETTKAPIADGIENKDYLVVGATQSSARVILAIQNALSKLA